MLILLRSVTYCYGVKYRRSRKVSHGNINPAEATEIFIRAALVEDELSTRRKETDDEK
jgi:hypothetical protein